METLIILAIIALAGFILSCLLSVYIIVGIVIFRKDLEKINTDMISVLFLWPYLLWIKRKQGKK